MKQLAGGVFALILVLATGFAGSSSRVWAQPLNAADIQILPESMGAPVSGGSLDLARGMGDQKNTDSIYSSLSNSTADISGSNFSNGITTGAFAGASGIVNVIQNAGSNVVIDNSVQVNLTFK